MAKRRKQRVPDLNREVANALGAATGVSIPKSEDLPGSDEARRELVKAKKLEKSKTLVVNEKVRF